VSFPPQKFGPYFIYDKLAVGGMAEIYKAKRCGEKQFQKTLIVKKLNVGKKDREYVTNLFIDEAHLCAQLNHPNIVSTYDFYSVADQYCIAMEYVHGQDLKQLLIKHANHRTLLSIEIALYIIHELCSALAYLHSQKTIHNEPMQLVHRDISPANILISYQGEIKLADFGIAKNAYRLYESNQGIRKGKYEYMSPEQAENKTVDHRSDIFCVGILLFELLTGRRLFKSKSDIDALEKIRSGQIPLASSLNSRISTRLTQIIHTALQPNPALRFQSAEQMRKAIYTVLQPQTLVGVQRSLQKQLTSLFAQERQVEQKEEILVHEALKKIPLIASPKIEKPQDEIIEPIHYKKNEEVLNDNKKLELPWIISAVFFVLWILTVFFALF